MIILYTVYYKGNVSGSHLFPPKKVQNKSKRSMTMSKKLSNLITAPALTAVFLSVVS